MLTKLTLTNFRGFERHVIPFRNPTIVVGRNNAGKSTIVEALRLVATVASRYRGLTFEPGPDWTGEGRVLYGVRPSLKNMEINTDALFHGYADPPAVINAQFSQGQTITVYIADIERVHCVLKDADGEVIRTRHRAIEAGFPTISIMPQVSPLQKREVILSPDYVRGAMSSYLTPLHFRNQLYLRYDLFSEFSRLVSETWPGVMIKELIWHNGLPGDELHLEVRNEDFVGEVGLMGHGLQMWLQTMWFLTLARDSDTIILDEPDVYMHPDLQRRIIRFLRNRHPQCIITTHSVEILSEVDAEQILVIDRKRRSSSFAPTIPAVQQLIDKIGSVHNIQVTRLWQARRFIMVEGKDIALLKAIQNTFFPRSAYPIDAIPSMQIGGWGGWNYAVGSTMLLRNAMDESITPYCILDSDYHTKEQILGRVQEARDKGVQLHIWTAKEIENYFLNPSIILRAIMASLPANAIPPSGERVNNKLHKIVNGFREDIIDGLATEIQMQQRKLTLSTARKMAIARVDAVEHAFGDITRLAPGKDVISRLSSWSQEKFRVPLNALKLARAARSGEIDEELISVLSSIENSEAFPNQ